jgi:hypothetical protein
LTTVAQFPSPVRLQAWQVPQLALLQQTLSTQLPVPHSWLVAQTAPAARLGWHWPPAPGQK